VVGSLSETGGGKLDRIIFLLELATIFCALVLLSGILGENESESKGIDFTATPLPSTVPVKWNFSVNLSASGRWHKCFQTVVEGSIGGEIAFGLILVFANRRRASADKIQIRGLELRIEELRDENLKLRKFLAPRHLSPQQMGVLYDFALREYDHDLDILIVGASPETKEYATEIGDCFLRKGWRVLYWLGDPKTVERDVYVEYFGGTDPATAQTARQLKGALCLAGIDHKDTVGCFAQLVRPQHLLSSPGLLANNEYNRVAPIRMYVGEKKDFDPTSDLAD
jgi:hypothetical protein